MHPFADARGFFLESWNRKKFADAGIDADFIQDNHSKSTGKVIRGLHYQDLRAPTAKLVRCTAGKILDVAVDLRVESPTFGRQYTIELSAENKTQLFVPVGFAHGFATLAEVCEVQYKQTGYYVPQAEGGIVWNDPDIDVLWPYKDPVMSDRDKAQPSFAEYRKKPAFK
jgi:dTDP-4-dehydrorhamnose 3,5-epimerase